MRGHYERRTWEYDPTLPGPARYRRACSYDAFVPDPIAGLSFGLAGHVAGVVSEAEAAIATLNADPAPELAPLARLLLRTESIASSKVEGLQIGVRQLARAEASDAVGRRIGADAAEILANVDAMTFAIERAAEDERVGLDAIADIHRTLMGRAPNANVAGPIRTVQDWIGGNDYNPCAAAYVPPPPEAIPPLLDDLVEALAEDSLPPLVHAALVHAQFETIHPFEDGNGRTGRALVHVVLRRRRLAPRFVPPISVVFARRKDEYIRGLEAYRDDRLDEWIEAFAVTAMTSARLAQRYLGRIASLRDEWRARLRAAANPRADAAAWAIIDLLPAHPVITVPTAVVATGRTRPAVTNGVDRLLEAGVLSPLGDSRRNRAWEADGLLELVASLEAGEM